MASTNISSQVGTFNATQRIRARCSQAMLFTALNCPLVSRASV
uniref:Uncharacterized protein n=1 Tax=Arundo donax TaxID=35708 RepID=A0A0A9HGX8_ARUDO